MADKKAYHFAGVTEQGTGVFRECNGGRIIEARPHVPGTPVPMGRGYGMLSSRPDGHAEIDIMVNPDGTVPVEAADAGTDSGGPAQVATEAYRDGWDRIFGGDASVN